MKKIPIKFEMDLKLITGFYGDIFVCQNLMENRPKRNSCISNSYQESLKFIDTRLGWRRCFLNNKCECYCKGRLFLYRMSLFDEKQIKK